jgi:hypothetical protein
MASREVVIKIDLADLPVVKELVARLRAVVDPAVAYVTEPEGSDEIPRYRGQLQEAVRQYQATQDGAQP